MESRSIARDPLLEAAKPEILRALRDLGRRVLTATDLRLLLQANRLAWNLPPRLTPTAFLEFLTAKSDLREVPVSSEVVAPVTRYLWGALSPLELALSLRKGAYLSHGTAVFLHGLTPDLPRTLYVNAEQSPKPSPVTPLTQDGIDLAFSRPPRVSRAAYHWERYSFVVVSGKFTNRLEVGHLAGPGGESLPATKLERTLIDIAVRPAYAGGVFKVLEAYTGAQDRISVNTLVATLKKLGHAYPYHQAIGFLLERAGCAPQRLEPLRKLEMRFDFYLSHGLREKGYDPRWKLFFPKGM